VQIKPKAHHLSKYANCSIVNREDASITGLQQELFDEGVVSRELLDAIPNPLLIISEKWQVVYANPAVRKIVDKGNAQPVKGLSVGEPFHCIHARQHIQEAGKHECCRICGVARVLSLSLKGTTASEDCRLNCELTGTASNLDLRVWATPLEFHGAKFSILTMVDISDKYKRERLENICFHDLLNTLSSIKGFLSIMKEGAFEDQDEICALLELTTQDSIDEIIALRLLEKGQQDNLEVKAETFESEAFLARMSKTAQRHKAAKGKIIKVAKSEPVKIDTDQRLLGRILSNMLINALEASEVDDTVTIGCRTGEATVRFWVHNDQMIPVTLRTEIFKQTASSKGHGRGNGTYSIKHLSDLIDADVYFTSTETDGTVFNLLLRTDPAVE
jgi:nitrogen-specific signal transduction histidine kinase